MDLVTKGFHLDTQAHISRFNAQAIMDVQNPTSGMTESNYPNKSAL